MDKLAQKRTYRSRLLEKVNLPGKMLEGLHGQLAEAMDEIREVDAKIRDTAEDVKPTIRNARSALRQRDYMNAAHYIAGFHSRCNMVKHILIKFLEQGSIQHFDYILENFDNKEQLFGYDPRAEVSLASAEFEQLVKEAGIKDTLLDVYDYIGDKAHNIFTPTGQSKRLMEKRFNTDFVKTLKDETTKIVGKSNRMLSVLLNSFDKLESGVSRRNPRNYIVEVKKLIRELDRFHKEYLEFDTKVLNPLREHQAAAKAKIEKANSEKLMLEQQRIKEEADAKAQREQDEANAAATEQARLEWIRQQQEQAELEHAQEFLKPHPNVELPEYEEPSFEQFQKNKQEELNKLKQKTLNTLENQDDLVDEPWDDQSEDIDVSPLNSKAPLPAKVKNQEASTDPLAIPEVPYHLFNRKPIKPSAPKKAHTHFIEMLEAYATDDNVGAFVHDIINYSEQLEDTDPKSSAELLTIANTLVEDYKKAGLFDKIDKLLNKKDNTPAAPKTSPQEFQRVTNPRAKTQDLDATEHNRYKIKKVDLPDGSINQFYSDIPFLSSITANRIIINRTSFLHLRNIIAHKIVNTLDLDDNWNSSIEFDRKLFPVIKDAIYNGLVIAAFPVDDTLNPRDKYIEVLTRININNLDSSLTGTAKLTIIARVSAEKNTVTVRTISRNFEISNLKEKVKPPAPSQKEKPAQPSSDENPPTRRTPDDIGEEDLDEPFEDQFDDPSEMYNDE